MTARCLTVTALVMCAAGFVQGADWWVDSLGTGDGTAPETPMASVQGAINAAGTGDTIHIRGGTGRLYTGTAYTVNKANLTLRDWEAKPIFRVLGTSDVIADRVVNVATNGVTLRNLRFEIQGNAIGANDDIVEITASARNVTLEGCEFAMTAFGGVWNQGSPIMQGSPAGTNIVVRDCLIANWDRDGDTGEGYRLMMVYLNGERCHIVGNVFTNTSRILGGTLRYVRFTGNRILNCRNKRLYRTNQNDGSMVATMFGTQLRDSEISHNIVWNNNGRRTEFLGKNREGFSDSNVRIFNNTIYNAEALVACSYYAPAATYNWRPRIYNNLLINNAYTNIAGTSATTTFMAATEIKHNLWNGTRPLTDPPSVGITPVNCYNTNCTFLNTTDTGSPDFLRPDGIATPQVMQGIGGAYPAYIGAVPPRFASSATVVLIR